MRDTVRTGINYNTNILLLHLQQFNNSKLWESYYNGYRIDSLENYSGQG